MSEETSSTNTKRLPRGTDSNPPNRFEPLRLELDESLLGQWDEEESEAPKTQYFVDHSQSIISYNDSPDLSFDAGLNPYRGCEHGCIYCYARPTHEYAGFSSGLDFESKIIIKPEAPHLLRKELASKRWKPQSIAMSGVTDCYQPIERQLKLTRGCLEVLAECRNPVGIVTKNNLVTRDIDLLQELARFHATVVLVSITTLDTDLRKRMEPRTSPPKARLNAVRKLADAGIPVGIMMAPIIPGLTDPEIPEILKQAAEHGAQSAGYTILRLPYAVSGLFENWLKQHFPDKADKVLKRIESIRSGKRNSSEFGERMKGRGIFADQIHQMFKVSARRYELNSRPPALSAEHFRRPSTDQLTFELL